MVELRAGDRLLARDRACRFRPDAVGAVGASDGLRGFSLGFDPAVPLAQLSLAIAGVPPLPIVLRDGMRTSYFF